MKRVLVFLDNFDTGGVTSVVKSIYRNIDREKFKMDFIRRNTNINDFDEEIRKNGDRVFYYNDYPLNKIPILNYKIKETNQSRQIIKELFSLRYDVIHIHANPVLGLIVAKKMKIPVKVMHVHEAVSDFGGNEERSLITKLIWNQRQRLYNSVPTVKAGDSMRAVRVKFGDDVINDRSTTVIYPPVDMNKFNPNIYNGSTFDIDKESFNIIHVGRLNAVKNQSFIIDVLEELNKKKNASLYIIGEGPLKERLELYAKEKGIGAKLHFMPADTSVEIYKFMNCSLLPSHSEAFGMVAVESQLMGVACFASTNVPDDVDIGMCEFLDLSLGAEEWAEKILSYDYSNSAIDEEKKSKFDIESIIKQVEGLYEGI